MFLNRPLTPVAITRARERNRKLTRALARLHNTFGINALRLLYIVLYSSFTRYIYNAA